MAHSTIVGGSTAKRVMSCPGSVALSAQMPPGKGSVYATRGTMLHNAVRDLIIGGAAPETMIGESYEGETIDAEMVRDKLAPALGALTLLDPCNEMDFAVEQIVSFGDYLPGVFGSADFLGRLGDTAYVLDWKFGSGVAVSAEENEQLMFYAAAAMRTPDTAWIFDGATEIECVIVQPPHVKRWKTTPERIRAFERSLRAAVHAAALPDAARATGEHCRWCPAKAICPEMTGASDRATLALIKNLNAKEIGEYLAKADLLEGWLKDLRALAMTILESGEKVPGYKLVQKRGLRRWVDEDQAKTALAGLGIDPMKHEIVSPAQAEKALKPLKKALPEGMAVSVSSGNTLAPEDDPRPEALLIGQQLVFALSKLN